MSFKEEIDKAEMRSIVSHFPELLTATRLQREANSHFNELSEEGIDGICFLGMGGSSIASRYVISLLSKTVELPLVEIHDRAIPAFISKRFVTVAVSYSGNTKETLLAHKMAVQRGCNTVAVTSGGKLSEGEYDLLITLPAGYPPRGAFPMMLSVLLPTAEILSSQPVTDFNHMKPELVNLSAEWRENNGPLETAKRISGRIPVFLGSDELQVVAYRAKCQINENAKSQAFASPLPEASHNEIEGYTKELAKTLAPVFLRSETESSFNRKLVDGMSEILSDLGYSCTSIMTKARNSISRMLDLTYYLDYLSIELASVLDVESLDVPMISRIKRMLE